jgi:hypothetical protein
VKILTPKVHGVIDYVSVGTLVLAPSVLGFAGPAALFAYVLAGIHLTMTLLTAFPSGVVKLIPFSLHGLVELVVGPVLLIGAWAVTPLVDLGMVARLFYSAFGVVLIVVWALTQYSAPLAQE